MKFYLIRIQFYLIRAQQSLDPVSLDLSEAQMVVPDTLSEEADEERVCSFLRRNKWAFTLIPICYLVNTQVQLLPPTLPSKDTLQFYDFFDHMVVRINLTLIAMEEISHPVFDILGATSMNSMSLPTLSGLLQTIWSPPASCQPISKKAGKQY